MILQLLLNLSWVALVLLIWFAWTKLWRPFRLYYYRQRLYRLRDDLFIFALEGKISFDDPAYLEARNKLHTAIRYAHEFTFLSIMVKVSLVLMDRWPAINERYKEIEKHREKLDSEAKEKLISIDMETGLSTIEYVASVSLIFLCIISPFVKFLIGLEKLKKTMAEIASTDQAWDENKNTQAVAQ